MHKLHIIFSQCRKSRMLTVEKFLYSPWFHNISSEYTLENNKNSR